MAVGRALGAPHTLPPIPGVRERERGALSARTRGDGAFSRGAALLPWHAREGGAWSLGHEGGTRPTTPRGHPGVRATRLASREATCLGPQRPPRKRPVPLCSPGASGPLPAAGRAASRAPRSRLRHPDRREPPRRARPRPPLPAPVPQPPCGLRPLGHQTNPERTEVDAAHRANRPPSEGPFEGGPRGAGARARVLPVRGHLFARREGA